ncbi:unnamed protein product [Mytilus edulis]|uniref:Uncharacterized protein n=1 Tax=Mytilus edulis TaxID=6550 RepID=A0A8S3QJD5_MYTED|nr:unnamed protein product [Mytilus edulis]
MYVQNGDGIDLGKDIKDENISHSQWTHNGKTVTSQETGMTKIKIKNALKSDAGLYVCTFGPNTMRLKYQLIVDGSKIKKANLDASMPKYWDSGIPMYLDAGIPIYLDAGIPKYPDAGIPKYPDAGIPKYPDAGIPKYPDAGIPKYLDAGIHKCPDAGISKCPDAGIPKYPDAGIPKYLDAGIPKILGFWYHNHSDIPFSLCHTNLNAAS